MEEKHITCKRIPLVKKQKGTIYMISSLGSMCMREYLRA